MKKETVLVCGGAGYIGSHTAVELLLSGYDVVIADNLSNSSESVLANIEKITGKTVAFENVDACIKEDLETVFKKYDFDSVIHFAAYKAVGESVAQPIKYYNNNLNSFINVITLMNEYDRKNIIFSSSATVYGDADVLPVTEKTPLKPANSPYGKTKQFCEVILQDTLNVNKNLNGVSLRYFNPIGAHESSLIGELPKGVPNNLVPFITQSAAGVIGALSVFGSDYPTPDGTCLRDYIDVCDLAKAHIATLKYLLDNKNTSNFEVFNVGTGTPLSVLQLLQTFEKVNDLKLDYNMAPRRPGDVPEIWTDASSAKEKLGWEAVVDIETTLKNAWSWEKKVRGL